MFRRSLRVLAATGAALVTFGLAAGPAVAATDSGWAPVGPSPDEQVRACGTTLTVSEVVNEVEMRTREDDQGNTRTDIRGRYVVKVTAPDGRKVRLNNSGPYSVFDYANGDTFVTVAAPGLIYPFDPAERAAFKAAGLPAVFYYTKGRLDLSIKNGVEKVVHKPADPVNICKLLR